MASLGGWFGIVQSSLPATVFVIVFALSKNTTAAAISAVAVSVFFVIWQLVQRKPVTQAIAGALGIALSAFLTLRDGGHPADYFIQGFFTNIAYGAVLGLSILVRWPVIGFLVGLLRSEPLTWRKNKKILRRADLATGLFVALFGARLLIQLPLYFANQIEALGIARVAMGVPLYALCIWLSWLLLRSSIAHVK
jgi:tetrahydromethanopterin S-methyltransferase subunit B